MRVSILFALFVATGDLPVIRQFRNPALPALTWVSGVGDSAIVRADRAVQRLPNCHRGYGGRRRIQTSIPATSPTTLAPFSSPTRSPSPMPAVARPAFWFRNKRDHDCRQAPAPTSSICAD